MLSSFAGLGLNNNFVYHLFYMKKILYLILPLFVFVALSSCNNNKPEKVAEEFLTSFYRMDYAEAKNHSTKKTQDILLMIEKISSSLKDSALVDYKNIEVEVVNVSEEKDKAVVTYKLSSDPTERHLNMIKESGVWKANFTKEDNIKEIEEQTNTED